MVLDRQTDEAAKTISLKPFLGDKENQDQKYDMIFYLFPHIYSNIYTIMDQTNFVASDKRKNFTLESVEMQDKVFSQTIIFLPNEI